MGAEKTVVAAVETWAPKAAREIKRTEVSERMEEQDECSVLVGCGYEGRICMEFIQAPRSGCRISAAHIFSANRGAFIPPSRIVFHRAHQAFPRLRMKVLGVARFHGTRSRT